MENKRLVKTFLFALAVIVIGTLLLKYTYKAVAEKAPEPEALVAQEWLQENVPEIKRLKAELEPLESGKQKRVDTLAIYGYSFDFDSLKLVPLVQ